VQRLWTPWRRAFVEGGDHKSTDECFLCEAPKAGDDRANLIVYRAEYVYVVLNRFPYNSGHLMIVPYIHRGDLPGLEAPVASQLMEVTQRSVAVLQRAYRPDGFNVGLNLGQAAGAGVPNHLHVHVVPRWVGDTNFMPLVGDTKVLPETLDQTYDRLEPIFRAD
jgi:ATP adenylyltransferase